MKDKWILEKADEISRSLYKLSFAELPEELQDLVHRWAKYEGKKDESKSNHK